MAPPFGNPGGRHPLYRNREAAARRDGAVYDAWIEQRRAGKTSTARIGDRYGISAGRVQQIVRRRRQALAGREGADK